MTRTASMRQRDFRVLVCGGGVAGLEAMLALRELAGELDLTAGKYALVCNISGHYPAGMYADFTVK